MHHQIKDEGGILIAGFEGDIDLENSGDVRSVLLDCVFRGRAVVVDMSKVSLIDSSGVAGLLEAFQSARKKGKKFVLADLDPSVMRVLKLARLDMVFVIADDIPGGLAKAG
ncbi:MAG: hypothetical protein A3G18_03045 [Rhodospirillales bacterium RIFCSPLOWO2_12_FULL_58_28]|nr:MAG: hypothetical protein A3H92_13435 [Rhodospirillales bacterium RIFCSPLOWO2_02_FULL_58_16]OHC77173.1 MAG: hypothetical protein A3G18_03045 [Rhodospirillales bacterium RIFCSPLOWO2_12_FULL_58_28]